MKLKMSVTKSGYLIPVSPRDEKRMKEVLELSLWVEYDFLDNAPLWGIPVSKLWVVLNEFKEISLVK